MLRYRKTFFVALIGLFWLAAPLNAAMLNIMPMGDSITEGISRYNYYSYRNELYDKLDQKYEVEFIGRNSSGGSSALSPFLPDTNHEGYGGKRTDDFLYNDRYLVTYKNLITNNAAPVPDIVLLHIGTNDLMWGFTALNSGNYPVPGSFNPDKVAIRTEQMVTDILGWGNNVKVVVAQIINRSGQLPNPEYNGDNSKAVSDYNDILEIWYSGLTDKSRIRLVDMEVLQGFEYFDELHPNKSGADHMANIWFDGMRDFLPPVPTPVPVPALLLGSGLACLVFLRRRRPA